MKVSDDKRRKKRGGGGERVNQKKEIKRNRTFINIGRTVKKERVERGGSKNEAKMSKAIKPMQE